MLVLFDIGSDKRFSFVIPGVNYNLICSADNFQWKIWWNRENKKNQNSIGNSIKNLNCNYFLMELLMDILLKEFDELKPDSSPFCPSFCFAKKKKNSNPYSYFLTNRATTNNQCWSKSIKSINIPLLVQFIYDLYVRVCLWFEGNWFYLSFDKIEFDFVT